jgi:hypothetical protein
MLGKEFRNNFDETQPTNKWVKKLQQESWELELLVSGFSIVLLTKLAEWLQVVIDNIGVNLNMNINFTVGIYIFLALVLLASYALIINLVIHLIFRGFWVGVVGLGSVAPTTNFEKLKYSTFFTQKLKKKITKLDDLVIVVDKISSLIFTFAFLIIFFIISVGLYLVTLLVLAQLANTLVEQTSGVFNTIFKVINFTTIILFLISGIIYMLDFLTLGVLKKNKRISRIYYPIYYFFSWITLSFLYRTLYYNLISKFSKRRIGLIIIPYLLIIIMVPLFNYNHHIYYPEKSPSLHIINNYYTDLRSNDDHIRKVDIPSYTVKDNFLPVFLVYNPEYNGIIRKLKPDFTPSINEGFNSEVQFNFSGKGLNISDNEEKYKEKSLNALASLFKIYLNDSLVAETKFYFKTSSEKKDKGIFTVLDIKKLSRGENILAIKRATFKHDSLDYIDYAFVPFWKE